MDEIVVESVEHVRNAIKDLEMPLVRQYYYKNIDIFSNSSNDSYDDGNVKGVYLNEDLQLYEVIIYAYIMKCYGIVKDDVGKWFLCYDTFNKLRRRAQQLNIRQNTTLILINY